MHCLQTRDKTRMRWEKTRFQKTSSQPVVDTPLHSYDWPLHLQIMQSELVQVPTTNRTTSRTMAVTGCSVHSSPVLSQCLLAISCTLLANEGTQKSLPWRLHKTNRRITKGKWPNIWAWKKEMVFSTWKNPDTTTNICIRPFNAEHGLARWPLILFLQLFQNKTFGHKGCRVPVFTGQIINR